MSAAYALALGLLAIVAIVAGVQVLDWLWDRLTGRDRSRRR